MIVVNLQKIGFPQDVSLRTIMNTYCYRPYVYWLWSECFTCAFEEKKYSESEEKIMCPKKQGRKEEGSDKIALFVIKVVE